MPALLALALQVCQMMPMPRALRLALPSQAFLSWRGLFTEHIQGGPLLAGVLINLAWTLVAMALAYYFFTRRDLTSAGEHRTARLLGVGFALVALVGAGFGTMTLAAPSGTPDIDRTKVESQLATAFAHLYRLQASELGHPDVTEAQLATAAQCTKGGQQQDVSGPGNDWRCVVTWHIPGARATGSAIYQLDIAPDGRVVADGDGPTDVNGYFPVSTPHGSAPNPLWQVDGLIDLLAPE